MTEYGKWLREKAIPLRADYTLNKETDEIVKKVYDYLKLPVSNKRSTQVKRFEALKCILGNFLLAAVHDYPVRYSRNPNRFPPTFYSPRWYTYRIVIRLLDGLREKGWITEKKGYRDRGDNIGWETRAYTNKKLEDFFAENLIYLVSNLVRIPIPNREIILRDESDREVPFEETEEMKQWRYDIRDYNSSIPPLLVNVEELPEELKEKYIGRVFSLGRGIYIPSSLLESEDFLITREQEPLLNDMLSLYIENGDDGRLPQDTENFDDFRLSLSKLRLFLTNNDSPILLRQEQVYRVFNRSWRKGGRFFGPTYQWFSEEVRNCILVDGQPTVEKDYSGMLLGMALNKAGVHYTKDPYERLTHGDPELKDLFKQVANAALCSEDLNGHKGRSRAIWGLNDKIRRGKLKMPPGLKTNMAMDKFVEEYRELDGMLFRGLGLELQFVESTIMNRIIKRLLRKGIFPLVIHDSARVQESYIGDLEQAMEEEYEKEICELTGKRYKPVIK